MPRFRLLSCLVLFSLLYTAALNAQQTPYNVFYRDNWQFVNPAAIDRIHYLLHNNPEVVFSGGSRLQWIGLEGAPLTYFASAEYCPHLVSDEPGTKLGLAIMGDRTDAITQYRITGNYSYFFTLPYKKGHILHLGISPTVSFFTLDTKKLRFRDPNDPTITNFKNQTYIDFSIGMLYRIKKKAYWGVSIPQTFALNLSGEKNGDGLFSKQRTQHVNFIAGGFIHGGDPDYSNGPNQSTLLFEPSCLIQYLPGVTYQTVAPGIPVNLSGNFRVHYMQQFWAGGGYGTNQIFNAEFGITRPLGPDKIKIGISYGVPIGRKYLSLGHSVELTVSYYRE